MLAHRHSKNSRVAPKLREPLAAGVSEAKGVKTPFKGY